MMGQVIATIKDKESEKRDEKGAGAGPSGQAPSAGRSFSLVPGPCTAGVFRCEWHGPADRSFLPSIEGVRVQFEPSPASVKARAVS